MAQHVKEIEFKKVSAGVETTYALEIDAEDPLNLVIESVTHVDGPRPEEDIDPDVFTEALDLDDWVTITNILLEAK